MSLPSDEIDVLEAVLLRHGDGLAVRDELNRGRGAEL
jgi:hypothetical protein